MEKTKITHLGSEYAKYLGYIIRVPTLSQNITSINRDHKTGKASNPRKPPGKPKVLAPLDSIRKSLINKGFANANGYPKYVGKFIYLSEAEIITRYNRVLRGLINFYNCAENISSLNEMVYIIEYSLAHTIAAKHRISLKKVFTKYGKPISTCVEGKWFRFNKPASLSAAYLNSHYFKPSKNFVQ